MAYSPAVQPVSGAAEHVDVRKISTADVITALRRGLADFWDNPTHYAFTYLVYPVIGIVLAVWTSRTNLLPLLYPLASGFALIGPFAAVGLYQISRRREMGLRNAPGEPPLLQSPRLGPLALLGILLLLVFMAWLIIAETLYDNIIGGRPPADLGTFLNQILTTQQGWTLIVVGNLVGFLFAAIVLAATVVAFPMLVDRNVGLVQAVETSFAAVRLNPGPMAAWGLIIAALLVLGSIPVFVGLIVVLPVLGHATWHLYRMVVAPAGSPGLA